MERHSLKQLIVNYLGRFTYRQRFVAWVVGLLLCLPLPSYWLLEIQNQHIARIDSQLAGNDDTEVIFKIFDDVIDDYINWVSHLNNESFFSPKTSTVTYGDLSVDLLEFENVWHQIIDENASRKWSDQNALFLQAIDLLNRAIKQIAYSSGLVLQTEQQLESLVQGAYLRLPSDSAYVAEIFALSILLKEMPTSESSKTDSPATMDVQLLMNRVEHFRQHEMKSKIVLEEAYKSIEEFNIVDDMMFTNARQELLDIYRWDGRFIDSVKQNLKLGSGQGSIEAKILTQRVIQNIVDTRKGAQNLCVYLLKLNRSKYIYSHTTFCVILVVMGAMLALILIFRILSGHFYFIQNYIQALVKGDFTEQLYENKNEDLGRLALALKEVGISTKKFMDQMQSLSGALVESTAKIADISYEQARVVTIQKSDLQNLEENSRRVANLSRELAVAMNTFAIEAKERLMEDMTKEKVSEMHGKLSLLSHSSEEIIKILSMAHNKVLHTLALAGSMMKVSEQASLLSLNADIESIQIGKDKDLFTGVTDKIKNFSDSTFTSSLAITKIVDEMSRSVSKGKSSAERCMQEISSGAGSLDLAKFQISRIIAQDDMQTANFQVINQMMGKQAELAEGIMTFIVSLAQSVDTNIGTLYMLYATVADLRRAAKELEGVLSSLFDSDLSAAEEEMKI